MKNSAPQFILGKVVPNIGKTSKYINSLIKSRFEEHNIPLSKEQFIVLLRLEEEPKPQSFLTMVTERNKGSLSRLVQSLEKKNYVKRQNCSLDNRVNQIEITQLGRKLLEKIKPVMTSIYDSVQTGITEKEKEITLKVLQKIQANSVKEMEQIERLKK